MRLRPGYKARPSRVHHSCGAGFRSSRSICRLGLGGAVRIANRSHVWIGRRRNHMCKRESCVVPQPYVQRDALFFTYRLLSKLAMILRSMRSSMTTPNVVRHHVRLDW
jgi:hypothetical protein